MKLKIEIIRLLDVAVIRCAGRIIYGPEATRLQETVERLLAQCEACILDFDGVTQVDARGLGTLAELARQARASQRSLCLVNVSRRVRELLRLARLDEVLEIVYPIEEREVEHRAVA